MKTLINIIIAPVLLLLASCNCPGLPFLDTIPGTYIHPSPNPFGIADDTLTIDDDGPAGFYRIRESSRYRSACNDSVMVSARRLYGSWDDDNKQLTISPDKRIVRFGRGYLLIGNHIYYKR